MLIEATPRDLQSRLALLPGGQNEIGQKVPGPEGATVTYWGTTEYRSADVAPLMEFVMLAGSTAVGSVIAAWIIDKFRGSTTRIRINHREVDLDDEGQVRRIVEDEIEVQKG